MKDVRLCYPGEVDAAALHAFLKRFFGPRKADFLGRHGTWWHGGRENRLVLEVEGTIAAYCGVIPVRCLLDGAPRDALWWMDLVVAPEYRGRRLQSHLDVEVRRRTSLLLGFPNELAARIHRKHGWGVREDLRTMLAPLDPSGLNVVRRGGRLLAAGALAARPLAALWRRRLVSHRPRTARRVDEPDVEQWAGLSRHGAATLATTVRDEAYLTRRYLEAPHRGELRFYESGTLALVSRRLQRHGRLEERVLDLFGDLQDRARLGDLLRFALGEASRAGAVQVTALASHGELAAAFRHSGFWLGSTARFCWTSPDSSLMEALERSRLHWCLGDSDNDDPA